MNKINRLSLFVLLIIVMLSFPWQAHAQYNSAPSLDFGSTLIWNSNTLTLTNGSVSGVNQITYLDGSSMTAGFPFPPTDPILGIFTTSPSVTFTLVPVSLSISFDGIQNDTLSIGSWLTADLEVVGPAIDPLSASPNPYQVTLTNISLNTGSGSQWIDEFSSVVSSSPANLNISWSGVSTQQGMGSGMYKVNAFSNVAVVPEPLSYILFVIGGASLAAVSLWKKRRNTV